MIKLAATTAAPVAATAAKPSAALIAYRTQRDLLVRECLFLRAEIAHLRSPNPLDTDHDAIKALGAGIVQLQGSMVKLRKASAMMIHRKPLHVIKASEPVQITGPGAVSPVAPQPGSLAAAIAAPSTEDAVQYSRMVDALRAAERHGLRSTAVSEIKPGVFVVDHTGPKARTGRMAQMAALMPAPAATTPTETKAAAKARKAPAAAGPRPSSTADAECGKLLARDGGATVAEIRAATGWKGPIMGGPVRAAKAVGKTLKWDGAGEARRFTLA